LRRAKQITLASQGKKRARVYHVRGSAGERRGGEKLELFEDSHKPQIWEETAIRGEKNNLLFARKGTGLHSGIAISIDG